MNKTLKYLGVTTALVGSISTYTAANATNPLTVQAAVEIVLQALDITSTNDLNFGTIIRPLSGQNKTIVVSTAGAASGDPTITGTISQGTYNVTGDDQTNIDLTVSANNTVTGLTLQDFVLDYGTDTGVTQAGTSTTLSAGDAPGSTGTTLSVGASLAVADNVTVGSHTIDYTITASYN